MATKYATNFALNSPTIVFNAVWKLTRCMKASGWLYMASGDGQNKDTSQSSTSDLWGNNADPMNDTYGGPNSSTQINSAVSLPQSTLTVVSNANFPNSGTVYVRSSTGIQTITYTGLNSTTQLTGCSGGTGNVIIGSWVSNANVNANFDGITTNNQWLVLRGPSTLKIPLSASPGNLVRGETITQTSTAAEGELIGWVWDSGSSSGWAVVAPRTGTFNNTNLITGASSGVSFTPTGTIVTFLREFMFMRSSSSGGTSGGFYYICADGYEGTTSGVASTTTTGVQTLPTGTINVTSTTGFPSSGYLLINTTNGLVKVQYTNTSGGNSFTGCTGGTGNTSNGGLVAQAGAESDQLFSTIATSSGCTGSNPPGWGGTNNAFPVKGMVCRGNGTSSATDFFGFTSNFQNYAQIVAVNNTSGTGVSADGSFWIAAASYNTANTATGAMFCRLEDTESGDLDPYAWIGPGGYQSSNYYGQSNFNNATTSYFWNSNNLYQNTYYQALGYQARGNTIVPIRDIQAAFRFTYLYGISGSGGFSTLLPISASIDAYPKLLATPSTNPAIYREELGLVCSGNFTSLGNVVPHWKGRVRWMALCPVGKVFDTFDSKTWLCVSTSIPGIPAILVGPWDGATVPIP